MTALAGPQAGSPVAAVVLAGGRASRLGGADKPGLTIGGGPTLLATAAAAAAGAGAARIIVVGPPRPHLAAELRELRGPRGEGPAVTFTAEQPPGAGPVPALRAGLRLVSEPWLLLLAADLPFLRDGHLRALRAAAAPAGGALLADDHGRPQWLISCWRTGLIRAALAGYHGQSLGGLLGPLRPEAVTAAGSPPPWLDCDTPADVTAAIEQGKVRRRKDGDEHDG